MALLYAFAPWSSRGSHIYELNGPHGRLKDFQLVLKLPKQCVAKVDVSANEIAARIGNSGIQAALAFIVEAIGKLQMRSRRIDPQLSVLNSDEA